VSTSTVALVVPLTVVLLLITGTFLAGRGGYSIGAECVVRCARGHLFTTIWLPGGSLKAIRLGWLRFQWCPVGRHWTFVVPVKDADLTPSEKAFARRHRDTRIP